MIDKGYYKDIPQLAKPKGHERQGFRGEAAAASDAAAGRDGGRSDTGSASGRGDGPTSTGGGDNQFAAPGTLSDPREKLDFFGPTAFGPARKFTGSFLDNILGSGYRPVTPTGQFQSRFSQMGGLGKGILGGLISLINPVAGLAYKGIDKLGALRDYDTLADYARGEFGLFQDEDEDEIDTIDIRDKYNRSGIMNPNLISPVNNIIPQRKPNMFFFENLDPRFQPIDQNQYLDFDEESTYP